VDEAARRFELLRRKAIERDVRGVVLHVLEANPTLMDADKQFRSWQQKLVSGNKINVGGKTLTQQINSAAQGLCQKYWAKITPGNVSLIHDNITGKCTTWESAERKFDWLWKKGQWTDDLKSIQLNGRKYTIEDLQQAERQCLRKFNLPAKIANRTPAPAKPAATQAQAKTETATSPQKCSSCGEVFLQDSAFCMKCGKKRDPGQCLRLSRLRRLQCLLLWSGRRLLLLIRLKRQ
jgi:hypothetical protein